MNLKPSPSRLSKQKQRPARPDEYSLPQKPNPRAGTHPGSCRDRPAGRRKSPGKPGVGGGGEPLSSVSPLCSAWLLAARRQGHPHPAHAPRRFRPLSSHNKAWTLPRHNRERVKGRCSPLAEEDRVHPAPLNSRVETSPWLNWLADRFPGCPLRPKFSAPQAGAGWVAAAPVPPGLEWEGALVPPDSPQSQISSSPSPCAEVGSGGLETVPDSPCVGERAVRFLLGAILSLERTVMAPTQAPLHSASPQRPAVPRVGLAGYYKARKTWGQLSGGVGREEKARRQSVRR